MFPIGALSARTGVNIETIRYYERIGLLLPPPRTASGRRMYDEDGLSRLAFIRHARDLGFSIPEVRALLRLQDKPEVPCGEASQIANRQLLAIQERIRRLHALEAELTRMAGSCADGKAANCQVIEALTRVNETRFV
jgi:DNA-binding transcriptional MerR regulator